MNPALENSKLKPDSLHILIADDHQLVRTGLKAMLNEHDLHCEIGEAESGAEALQKVREAEWDVVLLDISMPGMSGIDTLKEIKQIRSDLPVLILSMYAEDQYAVNLLRAGAGGYICKEGPSTQLLDAIVTVAAGQRYVSPELAEQLASGLGSESAEPSHTLLSDREFQVFCKLAAGRSVSGIAAELGLSVKTVSTYRTRILGKMKMSSNAELTFYATKNGLLR
jgi:two-component system, NarL family, invasion response regulator UvrY